MSQDTIKTDQRIKGTRAWMENRVQCRAVMNMVMNFALQ
jgi:hypothetical protein